MAELIVFILLIVFFGPVVIAAVRGWMNRRAAPGATPMSAAEAAFYRDMAHGRVFDCGRCGKPLSPDEQWCRYCLATFDQFPPVRTKRLF